MRSRGSTRAGQVALVTLAGLCVSAAPATAAPVQGESRPDEKTAEPPSRGLRLDVDRQVKRVLEQHPAGGMPRFETSVEVVARSPEAMLARFFGGIDLECGPVPGGAPTEVETRAFRPTPTPSVDLLAAARALVSRLAGKGPDRYFLYQARRGKDASYFVREDRVPDAVFYNTPGTRFELLAAFPDLDAASQALRRLERGFATPAPASSASPPAPWVTYSCRPRQD